jgi:hypothetical protein
MYGAPCRPRCYSPGEAELLNTLRNNAPPVITPVNPCCPPCGPLLPWWGWSGLFCGPPLLGPRFRY